ncbi:fucose-binding lectin II [Streptomyces hainanensis]|uniref:Calcium-mediated lectin domain-containing protein n=1 Tax=Streptomyces hainanensis TaxID=402648 RepID=A0A4R4TUK0_9ACTN|nr:fucose-binding lectin II [Streptomyces hainanensis]TDC79694.1 hypothetical protein E1283_02090 [Streptomyces hainanensis]
MSDTYVFVNGNKAEVSLPAGADVHVKVKTNSKHTQQVRLGRADGSVDHTYSGSGDSNTVIGNNRITADGKQLYSATFEYSDGDGAMQPSKLNSGGPYDIGEYHIMVVVAENGDDADYNDSILEFSWHTPKA